VNKIRNIIDNKVSHCNKSIDELFKVIFDTFNNAKGQVKDELKDIVALAPNNFGIYYLNKGLMMRQMYLKILSKDHQRIGHGGFSNRYIMSSNFEFFIKHKSSA
jgi:hypothetical protein